MFCWIVPRLKFFQKIVKKEEEKGRKRRGQLAEFTSASAKKRAGKGPARIQD
jgi:hypothetical protein